MVMSCALTASCQRDAAVLADEPAWVRVNDSVKSDAEWRCRTREGQRECRRRLRDASAFVCAGHECLQKWPRLPDVNEWDCHAAHGPVLCRLHATVAGLAQNVGTTPDEEGFVCGTRRGHDAEKLCIDRDPDLPPEGPWTCRFDATKNAAKLCVRALPAAQRASVRDQDAPPECWLDEDCGDDAVCEAGRCTAR